ncbi:MAG: ATP-binding protein [Porticoccaceae bacterium]
MSQPAFDITPFLHQDEGQHFDRKSLYEGTEGAKRARNRRAVRDQVAEYVAGFANAEGGVLVLGIEDDHSVTGHSLPADALASLLSTPRARLQPPQSEGFLVETQGKQLIVFDVPAADVPVQVVGDGFPLRIGDKTLQVSETQIRALKLQGLAESWESRPAACTVADLDRELIAQARQGAGLAAWSDEDYLLKRKLADRRGDRIQLRRAAELLFTRFGPDHPNAGVRIFRVIGTERRTGPEHNVEERPRIEGNLPAVMDQAAAVVSSLLRRPSRLVGTRFRPVPEYPEFSWKEALLNAVAHRDYGVEGAGTEIWLFEDRMEIISPGGLIGDLTLDEVLSLRRIHRSRNPRLMRVLVDLGVARDQGEGIPRMFAEMEDAFLPKPEITASPRGVTVTLRNTPTLTAADREFVSRLGSTEISDEEFRALLHAHRNGRVENADLRSLAGMDTLAASLLLRKLRDRSLLDLHPHGANSYYTLPTTLSAPTQPLIDRGNRGEPSPDRGGLIENRGEPALDRGELATNRGERDTDRGELAPEVLAAIQQLGTRPRKERLRAVIASICAQRDWTTPAELARWLNIRPANLTERHLSPMVKAGQLERRFPDAPTHAEQAYRSSGGQLPLGLSGESEK